MNILIVNNTKIPAEKYGGTERVIWGLGKALTDLGHTVSYMVAAGSSCSFAKQMLVYDSSKSFEKQIPEDIDVVHYNWQPKDWDQISKAYVATLHGNINYPCILSENTIFISPDQAKRHGGEVFVYNGLDWNIYPKPVLNNVRNNYFHFLADAAWKVKNVKGAIRITKQAGERLEVLGGYRLNLNMGFRFTPDMHVRFRGKVDDAKKAVFLNKSKGLIFPVLWNEPFGLAIIESLYFGCPVFATPYGSLKELVTDEVGFLSNSETELSKALKQAGNYNRVSCSEYVAEKFNSLAMAKNYLKLYEKVLNGELLHAKKPEITEATVQKTKYLEMLP